MDVNYRISGGKSFFMKALAYLAYGFNFLLQIVTDWIGIGLFLSPLFMTFVYGTFAIWFALSGVSILDMDKLKRVAFGWFISCIPVINLLYFSVNKKTGIPQPGVVRLVDGLIEKSQEEDKAKAEAEVEALQIQRTQDGFRENYRMGASTRYEDDGEGLEEAA